MMEYLKYIGGIALTLAAYFALMKGISLLGLW